MSTRWLVSVLLLLAIPLSRPACAARPPALESGKTYTLEGRLSLRYGGEGEERQVWLDTNDPTAPGTKPLAVELAAGTYPRTPQSIYREYGPDNKVLVTGVASTTGQLLITLQKPGFVPYVPVPLKAMNVAVEGDILSVTVATASGLPRSKLVLRHEIGFGAAGRRALQVWVECPDPHQSVSSGPGATELFTLDLRAHFGAAPIDIAVSSGKCDTVPASWDPTGGR